MVAQPVQPEVLLDTQHAFCSLHSQPSEDPGAPPGVIRERCVEIQSMEVALPRRPQPPGGLGKHDRVANYFDHIENRISDLQWKRIEWPVGGVLGEWMDAMAQSRRAPRDAALNATVKKT